MIAAKKQYLISVADYLQGELESPIKHEYRDGFVYAMAGGRNLHSLIASNTLVTLGIGLRSKPCRAYNSDAKIRILSSKGVRFYYPDASVVCEPNPDTDTYHDKPVVIAEVLSPSTRRIDEGEKNDAYQTIPTLAVYLLIEQDFPAIVAFRRNDGGFVREVYEGLDAVVPLSEIGTELPLREVYDNAQFVPEPVTD